MLADIGFVNIELKKDMNDKDRMIKAIKKNGLLDIDFLQGISLFLLPILLHVIKVVS